MLNYLFSKQSHYHRLKKKWTKKHRKIEKEVIKKHGHLISNLIPKQQVISSLMLAAVPLIQLSPGQIQAKLLHVEEQKQNALTLSQLKDELKSLLPEQVEPLNELREQRIAKFLSEAFHIKVYPKLEGISLDRSYGYIGQEQHLRRYPGDSNDQHAENEEEARLYSKYGTAPGLGAWGYFAKSKQEMTQKEKLKEKYYIAVQTFLAPGFNENVGRYGLFFKHRKMLLVNPENGKALIAVIGDAGPAKWTGKHLGGSPEVMHYLERVDGSQKGPVLYFFVDDPNDTIPLGPITL